MESDRPDARRDASVDVARGIAITAIVLGHVERGLAAALLLPHDHAAVLDRLLYLVHLSTFAYLSGLFIRRAVDRDGPRGTLARRIVLFGWLYLLWTAVQGLVRVAASSRTNTAVTPGDLLRLWVPEGQLWFLPWLVGVTVVAVVARPWSSVRRGVAVLVLAAALALAVWGYEPPYVLTRGWALLLPFLVGVVTGHRRHAGLARRLVPVAAVAVVGGAVWLWIGVETSAVTPTTGGVGRSAPTVALGVLGCGAGTVALVALAALVARTPVAGFVSMLGRRSLEIFLAHVVVASGTRIVLVGAGETDPWVHLVAATALGVGVPVLLAAVAERAGWTWVFGLPRVLARTAR